MTSLTSDLCWNAARELSHAVAPALNDSELREFFLIALRICRELLTEHESKRNHEAARLGKPLPSGEGHHD
jgi:hypothetical protein